MKMPNPLFVRAEGDAEAGVHSGGKWSKGAQMNARVLIGCLLILVLCAFSAAEGAEWVSLGPSETGDMFSIDITSIARTSQDMVKVWTKSINSDATKAKLKAVARDNDPKETRTITECNCAAKEFRYIRIALHDPQGNILHTVTYKNGTWDPIPPESMVDRICRAGCSKKDKE
jgi:hypothetical protein